MKDVLSALTEWVARGDRIALATVVGARSFAGRGPGAKLAVNSRGELAGGMPGRDVQDGARRVAEAVLQGQPPQLVHFGIAGADASRLGIPSAEIDVWVDRYEPGRFLELARTGGRAAEVTLLEGAAPGAKLVLEADGSHSGSLGAPELDDEAVRIASELLWKEVPERFGSMFVDVLAPPPRLIVFGAVDLAVPLCRLARAVGWLPFVVDPRAGLATAERFPDAERVIAAWPAEAVAELGGIDPACSVVVLAHEPEIDDAALSLALRTRARFVGAIGSRRTQARRRERLLAAGFAEEDLQRIAGPVGLDLGARERDETALSILAEAVAARHGRGGGRLSARAGSIHEVAA